MFFMCVPSSEDTGSSFKAACLKQVGCEKSQPRTCVVLKLANACVLSRKEQATSSVISKQNKKVVMASSCKISGVHNTR